jgi:hypothetical protein
VSNLVSFDTSESLHGSQIVGFQGSNDWRTGRDSTNFDYRSPLSKPQFSEENKAIMRPFCDTLSLFYLIEVLAILLAIDIHGLSRNICDQ